MPNEEILSALRNAIDHGESLQSAVQIMINSGYNPEEVQEASKFIGGTLSIQEPMPEEQLTMPEEKKSFYSKFKFFGKNKKENQIIQKPSESMKLSSDPLNKQKIAFAQTIQQYPQQPAQQYLQQQQPIQQIPQQPTQAQIKQSFYHPIQQPTPQSFQQPIQQYPQQPIQQPIPRQAPRPTPQLMLRQGNLSREIQKIKPAKQSYLKEIILLIILLILIGILAATIFFRDKILGWFA